MAGVLTVSGPDRGPAASAAGPSGPTPSRIAVVGGGPGGLYAAALLKRLDPRREVTVWERNAPSDTFGFGVVLSDETLGGIRDADPVVYEALRRDLVRWDDIDVVHRGHRTTSTGHGFAALGRRRLLEILHARCTELGVRLRFRAEAPPPTSSPPATTSSSPPTASTAAPARPTPRTSAPGSPPTAAATSGSPRTSPSTPSASRSPRRSTA